MKITISHDQESIDPNAICTAAQFEESKQNLELLYREAILLQWPLAEVDFSGTDTTYAVKVSEVCVDPSMIVYNLQRTLESVYEAGNFWA